MIFDKFLQQIKAHRLLCKGDKVLLALSGIAPLLAWRKTSINSIKRNFLLPIIFSGLTGLITFSIGIRKVYPLITLTLIGFVFSTIILEFYRGTKARMKSSNEHVFSALISILDKNTTEMSFQIVHILYNF